MERDGGDVEERIRALCGAGDHRGAATAGLRAYGPEIYSYLHATARTESDANDAYGGFGLALWQGLPGFRWECSFRTWSYTLARHALFAVGRDTSSRAREVPLSLVPDVFAAAEEARSRTVSYLRSEVKDKIARLRESLAPEDRARAGLAAPSLGPYLSRPALRRRGSIILRSSRSTPAASPLGGTSACGW